MLKENQIKAIKMYVEGTYSMQQIAEECGYKHRKSIYDLLEKPEAQELIEKFAGEALQKAMRVLQNSSYRMAIKLVEIGNGEINDNKTVFAQLNAINSILEKVGFNSKNTITIENKNSEQEEKNELLELLNNKKTG